MKLSKNTVVALILIVFGGLLLLNKLGFHTGALMGWLFPIAMVGLGWLGLKNGRSAIGIILMAIGGLVLLGKLSGIIFIIIAIALIVYGISLLRKNKSVY